MIHTPPVSAGILDHCANQKNLSDKEKFAGGLTIAIKVNISILEGNFRGLTYFLINK